jgi:outer membrane protein assembly factor BamB
MSGPIVKCGDAGTGKLLWQLRLKGAFTSSPVAADGHLYYFSETGLTYVVDITGPKGKIVAENELGATILCTPAIADNSIFVRSDGYLWKISR